MLSKTKRSTTVSGYKLAKKRDRAIVLNDTQSQLNPTRVQRLFVPTAENQVVQIVRLASKQRCPISVSGGRNAMGGQQFGTGTFHINLSKFNRVLALDTNQGLVTVQSGIHWPELIAELHGRQAADAPEIQPWTIRQKQTGVDAASIDGALAANIHGRGLDMPPFINDIESFRIIDGRGNLRHCSRNENAELFSLAIGGYGLFGIVTEVTLRLVRRFKVKRRVEQIPVRDILQKVNCWKESGARFGDCQYAIDLAGPEDGHMSIAPCYEAVELDTPITASPVSLQPDDWARLYRLTRTDKRLAFELYANHYKKTDGQIYWSDTHQLSGAFSGHKQAVDATKGTEVISEFYLDYENALPFLSAARHELKRRRADITYGTIRFIERDNDSFLCWARRKSVCIIVNLHVEHSNRGILKAKSEFRALLDLVIRYSGSFYLTYHRWARRSHLRAAYPQICEFLLLKDKYDPEQIFQSDWHRHLVRLFDGKRTGPIRA